MKSMKMAVRPVLVRDSAVQTLRNAIISGEIKPGTRLVERELCEALGISRGSVREVIRQLEVEKLISVEPRKGPTVTALTPKQIMDIYNFRMVIEAQVAQWFTSVATDEQIQNLRGIYRRLQQAVDGDDRATVLVSIEDFTSYMAEVVDNEIVQDTLQFLNARIASVRATAVSAPGRMKNFRVELDEIFRAIETRDPVKAMEATQRYVLAARDAALSVTMTDRADS